MGNSKTREVVIPFALAISFVGLAISGGIVWGQTQQKLNNHEERLGKQELINEKVQEIWRKQGVLENKMINIDVQQRRNFQATQKSLDRILEQTSGNLR